MPLRALTARLYYFKDLSEQRAQLADYLSDTVLHTRRGNRDLLSDVASPALKHEDPVSFVSLTPTHIQTHSSNLSMSIIPMVPCCQQGYPHAETGRGPN